MSGLAWRSQVRERGEPSWGLPGQLRGRVGARGLPGRALLAKRSFPLLIFTFPAVVVRFAAGGWATGVVAGVGAGRRAGAGRWAGVRVARGCWAADRVASRFLSGAGWSGRCCLCGLTSLPLKNDGCPQPLKNTSACCEDENFQAEGSGWILSRRRRRRGSPGGAMSAVVLTWRSWAQTSGSSRLTPGNSEDPEWSLVPGCP